MLHAVGKVNVQGTRDRKPGLLSRVIAADREGVCNENPLGR